MASLLIILDYTGYLGIISYMPDIASLQHLLNNILLGKQMQFCDFIPVGGGAWRKNVHRKHFAREPKGFINVFLFFTPKF
jgi:hypothetical protein